MYQNAHDAYVESRVLSADPLELVRLLYLAAIDAVRDARRCLAAGEIAARSRSISRACEILIELTASLDRQRGGQIADRLAQLYDYMQRQLLEANLRQSDAPLAEVLGLLSTLAEGWEGIQPKAEPAAVAAGPWAQSPPAQAEPAAHAWSF